MPRAHTIAGAAAILAFSGAAAAQSSNVSIYGRLYPQYAYVKTTGATAPDAKVSTLVSRPSGEVIGGHDEVQASNSRVGIRGAEKLGSDLTALWQIEQQVNVDEGGGRLASRNTFVGLQGAIGTVRLGILDTVYKDVGDTLSFLGISSGNFVSDSSVLSKCGIGTSSACSFHLRRGNSVRYDSPSLAGFEFKLQWSPDEQKNEARNAYLVSAGATFAQGPLYLGLGYELHNDFFGGSRNSDPALSNFGDPNASSRDYAVRGTVKYDFGRHDVELDAARLAYRETGGAPGKFESYANNHFAASLRSRWGGAFRTQIGYVYATEGGCSLSGDAACSAEGLDGQQLALGVAYYFSRRFYAYLIGAKLWNGHSARYSNLENGDPATGADITQAALGLTANF